MSEEERTTVLDFPLRPFDLRARMGPGLWELIGSLAEEELLEALGAVVELRRIRGYKDLPKVVEEKARLRKAA